MITFIRNHIRYTLAIGLCLATLLFAGGAVSLFAAAPSGGYNPGDTLDPDCAPGDPDCFVTISTSGGGSSVISLENTESLFSTGLVDPAGTNSPVSYSVFLGANAGNDTTQTDYSVFIGQNAGDQADRAYASNFIGRNAGLNSIDAGNSNFFGEFAGEGALNAYHSNFFGRYAGYGAAKAANSIFIGRNAGSYGVVDNTESNTDDGCDSRFICYSILLGPESDTGGFSNSMAFGAYAQNTKANQLMIGSYQRPIDEVYIYQSEDNACIIDVGGITCSSDETLKKDIDTIDNALSLVTQLEGVTYYWKSNKEGTKRIPGFIAQEVKEIIPEAVTYNEVTGKYGMNYTQLIPYLVESIKTLNFAVNNGTQTGATISELVVKKLRAHEIQTDKFCMDGVCMDSSDFKKLLDGTKKTVKVDDIKEEEIENTDEQNQPVDETVSDQITPTGEDQETLEISPETTS